MTFYARGQLVQNGRRLQIIFLLLLHTAMESQRTVTDYFTSKQLLLLTCKVIVTVRRLQIIFL